VIFNSLLNPNQDYKSKIPTKGALLGIDVGTKRIGIATSDKGRFLATPKLVLNRQSNLKDFAKITKLIEEFESCALVIGYPVNMAGDLTEMSIFSGKFTENLNIFLEDKMPIFLFEERLSSFEAKNFGYSKISRNSKNKHVDDIAASIILQHFLDDIGQSSD
jgi:putative Holliday junction resolvase